MRMCIVAWLMCISAYAQTLVDNVDIKQESDRVEILLTFKETYTKSPHLTKQDGYKGVIFPTLEAKSHNQSFKGFFLNELQIFNIQDNLYVLGIGDTQFIDVNVSKAPYALKIIFSKAIPPQSELDTLLQTAHQAQIPQIDIIQQPLPTISEQNQANTNTNDSNGILPFKNDLGIDTWRYVAVLIVMALLVLVLWVVKRYVVHKKQFGHYFAAISHKKHIFDPTKIEVVSQKNLDSKHKILTIESNGYRYLILIGATSTTLIDRYPIPQSITPEEQLRFDDQFAKLLEQKQERLSQYLHNDSTT